MENIWIKLNTVTSNDVTEITKSNIYYRKYIDMACILVSIDFYTKSDVENQTKIQIDIPEFNCEFDMCENTIFATKDDDTDTITRVFVYPKKLVIHAYPFSRESNYEMNFQMFMRIKE